jgi:hypothetical protein
MDDAVIVSLLQQIVDGLDGVKGAVDEVGNLLEQNVAWIGEKMDEQRLSVVECRERIDMEGSHIQDRLNEIKRELTDLPGAIGSYMN